MSKIEWTDETWNVITGCTQISPACKNCYAKAMTKRMQGMAIKEAWAKIKCEKCERGMLNDDSNGVIEHFCECEPKIQKFEAPKYYYGWDKVIFHTDMLGHIFDKKKYPSGCKVFVNSMSDTFHEEVSYLVLKNLFFVMQSRSDVTFQILTKRPLRMWDFLISYPDMIRPNMMFGVTAENQKMADERIKRLLRIKESAKTIFDMDITIFVSCEPLLESIDLSKYINELDWVIVGGERAHKKGRVMQFEYVRNIYILCKKSNTPFFFKQWGDCEKAVKDSLVSDDLALTKEIENTKEFTNQKE
ncbi:DUF5131 family protein [Helicobacter pullorum]|uniref:DUF5131 family protein n=1 Tax=Helicobacter pullorum TaxID=35818 RepID=UPI00174B5CA5|nr:DUF5131 family protein [Helicobacter pullorum]